MMTWHLTAKARARQMLGLPVLPKPWRYDPKDFEPRSITWHSADGRPVDVEQMGREDEIMLLVECEVCGGGHVKFVGLDMQAEEMVRYVHQWMERHLAETHGAVF